MFEPAASGNAAQNAAFLSRAVIFQCEKGFMKNLILIGFALAILIHPFSIAESKNKTEIEADLIAAELYCFSLEGFLFEVKDNYKSQHEVFEFFRQGFGPSISEKLAANIWNSNQVKLKDGDQIMEPPKNVHYKSIEATTAVISFETPQNRKHIWGNSKYTELIFRKEDERWKLFQK
jgi:hypothetical protein